MSNCLILFNWSLELPSPSLVRAKFIKKWHSRSLLWVKNRVFQKHDVSKRKKSTFRKLYVTSRKRVPWLYWGEAAAMKRCNTRKTWTSCLLRIVKTAHDDTYGCCFLPRRLSELNNTNSNPDVSRLGGTNGWRVQARNCGMKFFPRNGQSASKME